jgi:8-amino-7-oxononanoate synthase
MITDLWFRQDLADLASVGRLREPQTLTDLTSTTARMHDREVVVFCSNDYLNMRWHPALQTVLHDWSKPVGAGASRMVSGDLHPLQTTERALCAWLSAPSALLFSSGYAANVGAIGAVSSTDDVVFSDSLNHASIVDGCRLARSRTVVYPHNDVAALTQLIVANQPFRRGWIVTESIFSMDGDTAPLVALRRLADQFSLGLYVDEAHALGICGDQGRGQLNTQGVCADLMIGTFGKSLGVAGAFAAGSEALRSVLWNRARSFVFSTGLPLPQVALIQRAIQLVQSSDESRSRLIANINQLGRLLGELTTADARRAISPIFPVILGDEARTVACSRALLERGFFVSAIRPPTVPRGTSRLRITVSADHTLTQMEGLAHALRDCLL